MLDLFLKPVINFVFGPPTKSKSAPRQPQLYYQKFTIRNFKGITKVEVSFARNDIVLLLGLNESGKTTILKGIEAFDFLNDPSQESDPKYFSKIRRKSDVGSNTAAEVTAHLRIEKPLKLGRLRRLGGKEITPAECRQVERYVDLLNRQGEFTITRVFPFKGGDAQPNYYRFGRTDAFTKSELSRHLAAEIVHICPFIIYFEDFKDRVPERIFMDSKSDAFDPVWHDIIDGLFYNTSADYSVEAFRAFYSGKNRRDQDARTVLKQVNKSLNYLFTKKWKKLSGVKGVASTELAYDERGKFFQLTIYDADGTNYTADERSRGAVWYLSFLMKTEFRSKKLRRHSGKPVYLIDEPASNLHSTAQQNMVKDFVKLAENTSIMYSTHSQYLISTAHIRNTCIIKKSGNGNITATPWGEYLRQSGSKVSYYQPLANHLQLVPHSVDVPWSAAVITEGPSDRHVLLTMHRVLRGSRPDYVIYPGTNAHNLGTLIELNIGWGANFSVFLDADTDGVGAKEKYERDYGIGKRVVLIPRAGKKIEACFNTKERSELYRLAFKQTQDRVSKKEFAATFAILDAREVSANKISRCLEPKTLELFDEILEKIEVAAQT